MLVFNPQLALLELLVFDFQAEYFSVEGIGRNCI